ncbi:hypothetical protein GQX73_g5644 [Xylaria multiplex]|uniref:Uncharacterized protein n=1 Tax=Xylaria multiplex TaxID=323545 RepID=A0A7C8IN41_9PEZI|nr:hypothetical protein GQX73_g5644 [Xylaria multiplex]
MPLLAGPRGEFLFKSDACVISNSAAQRVCAERSKATKRKRVQIHTHVVGQPCSLEHMAAERALAKRPVVFSVFCCDLKKLAKADVRSDHPRVDARRLLQVRRHLIIGARMALNGGFGMGALGLRRWKQ